MYKSRTITQRPTQDSALAKFVALVTDTDVQILGLSLLCGVVLAFAIISKL